MVLNLIGMLVILYVIRRFAPRLFAGDAVLMYIMWYGSVRTLLETYRVNNWTILGVPTAMWIGLIGVVLAAGWFWYRHRRGLGSPMIRPPDEPVATAEAPQPQPEPSAG
jgi:prolipoprotein diacylglyceryltransferase